VRRENHKRLGNRKRRIEYRLREMHWAAQADPMFSARNIHYELSGRTRGLDTGGIGAIHRLARQTGLIEEIDSRVEMLKVHLPYHESDHVLNIAYNVLSGGRCLEDIEWRRNNEVYLDALGAQRIPDPTTAGDFCRRSTPASIEALMEAINETRLRVWAQQPDEFFAEAKIDADGTLAPTSGHITRLSDHAEPKRIAFLQCVGSRDKDHDYCSSICCMYATKEAMLALEHVPGVEIHIFQIDMRAFSKGFDAYFERGKAKGIHYHRCKISALKEDPRTREILIDYVTKDGKLDRKRFDLSSPKSLKAERLMSSRSPRSLCITLLILRLRQCKSENDA